MGRIADTVGQQPDAGDLPPFTNKVDVVLESLDDDDDRRVVLSWLRDPLVADELIEDRLRCHGFACSDSTIRRWRRAQDRGVGRLWDV